MPIYFMHILVWMNTTTDAVQYKWSLVSAPPPPPPESDQYSGDISGVCRTVTKPNRPRARAVIVGHHPTAQAWEVCTAHAQKAGTGLIVGGWGLDSRRARTGGEEDWWSSDGAETLAMAGPVTQPVTSDRSCGPGNQGTSSRSLLWQESVSCDMFCDTRVTVKMRCESVEQKPLIDRSQWKVWMSNPEES